MAVSFDEPQLVELTGIGGSLVLILTLVNNSDHSIPREARITFEGNRFFKPLDQRIPREVKPRSEHPTKLQIVGFPACRF